jgi:hypothetical protein
MQRISESVTQDEERPCGALVKTWRRCGKTNCRCTRGKLHGPYYRRMWREFGQLRAVYVRKADVERVRGEIDQARAVAVARERERAEVEVVMNAELAEILTPADAFANADAIFAQLAAYRRKYLAPQVAAARGRA